MAVDAVLAVDASPVLLVRVALVTTDARVDQILLPHINFTLVNTCRYIHRCRNCAIVIYPSVHVFATLSVGTETLFVEKALLLHITSPFSLQRHAAWEDV